MSQIIISGQRATIEGGAIKALDKSATRAILGGTLCLFSTPDDADGEGDFFDAATDFDFYEGMKSPVYFHHALTKCLDVKRLGRGGLVMTPGGVDIEADIDISTEEGALMYDAACKGMLGWSSGTALHLLRKTAVATKSGRTAHHIDYWPLGLDASLTPNPAEKRNIAHVLKSLFASQEEAEAAFEEMCYSLDYTRQVLAQTDSLNYDLARCAELQRDLIVMQVDVMRAQMQANI